MSENDDEPMVTIKVEMEVTEQVSCTVTSEFEVPAGIANDADALLDYLNDDSGWVDDIDPSQQEVLERDVDSVKILTNQR